MSAVIAGGLWMVPAAAAATTDVNLATASSFAVLAGSTITNTGPTVVAGDVGLSPGTAVTGFPPGIQSSGAMHVTDAVALGAQNDLTTAYNDAAARTSTSTISSDLGGSTLVAGVYTSASSLSLTGALTLDGGGNPDSVFIFQAGSTLTTATGSGVILENGAQACHVYWQVGSSATLGTTSQMSGSIMALTSITLDTSASVAGRVLARNGAVTMDDNLITVPTCALTTATTTTSASSTTTTLPATTTTSTSTTTTTVAPTTTTTVAPTTTTSTVAHTTTTLPATTTTTLPAVIPTGPPGTGFGGTAPRGGVPHGPLIAGLLGLSALFGSLALRQRRAQRVRGPRSE